MRAPAVSAGFREESALRVPRASPMTALTALIVVALVLPALVLFLDGSFSPSPTTMLGWNPALIIFRSVTDICMGLAYLAVSVSLLRAIRSGRDRPLFLPVFLAFGASILLGSVFQMLAALTHWEPAYWAWLLLRYASSLIAVATAACIPAFVRKMVTLVRSADTAIDQGRLLTDNNKELQALNADLQRVLAERSQAEERGVAHLLRLQAIIDSLPIGALAMNGDGSILHLNRQCCAILGIARDAQAFIGRPAEEFFAVVSAQVADADASVLTLEAIRHGTVPVQADLHLRDGRIVQRDMVDAGLGGRMHGKLFLYRDITRERRADTVKSEFMSLASHQLRTPLTAIRWSLGRMRKASADPAERDRLLDAGTAAARRMAHTIDTMLLISRIEAGKVRAEVSEIKLGAFLNDLRVESREEYEAKRLSFTLRCPPHLLVRTDPDILGEVLKNLCSNAIKYTPEGGSVSIGASMEGGRVRIEVSDTGCGIPLYQQEKVFGKFFRGDNVVASDTEGTGLGLYLVYLLTVILEGKVGFRSAEGEGTTFFVDIPVARTAG